jgi:hypothetical protein
MAWFMGGIFDDNGNILEIGVGEKEVRQHCATFRKIYQQLTEEQLQVKPNSVKGCQSTGDAWQDTYKHVISRLSTEWGATSVYFRTYAPGLRNRVFLRKNLVVTRRFGKKPGFFGMCVSRTGFINHLISPTYR